MTKLFFQSFCTKKWPSFYPLRQFSIHLSCFHPRSPIFYKFKLFLSLTPERAARPLHLFFTNLRCFYHRSPIFYKFTLLPPRLPIFYTFKLFLSLTPIFYTFKLFLSLTPIFYVLPELRLDGKNRRRRFLESCV